MQPSHYGHKYDSKERFCSYWHQIQEVLLLNPKEVLEIGIGNGFVSEYLRKMGLKIITLDIDEKLKPDVTASILKMPFNDASFDVVACCEVLEHLPFENFNRALSEVFRVSREFAVLSLPDISRAYRFNMQIPKIGEIKKLIKLPMLKNSIHQFDGEHYWEIGKANYSLKKIMEDIKKIANLADYSYFILTP